MNRIDKLIRSAIKESMDEKADELHSMIQDEDWNPNGPVTISGTDISEEDEFDVEDDYVMDKIKRECEDDPESESCRKHKEYAGLSDGGELEEILYGGQKRLDRNKNGRLDKEDFKLIRGSKKKKEVGEIELSKLKKGGKYKYKKPSFEDEIEYKEKKEYPFGSPMHSFRGKKADAHLMGDDDIESFVSDFDELGEGIGYHDNIDSDHFHEKTGGMYNMGDEDFEDVEEIDVPFNKRRPTDDEYVDFEEMRPTEKKSFFSRMKNKLGLGEEEAVEGNAFTGALDKARKEGDPEFKVGGKKYETKEGKKNLRRFKKLYEQLGTGSTQNQSVPLMWGGSGWQNASNVNMSSLKQVAGEATDKTAQNISAAGYKVYKLGDKLYSNYQGTVNQSVPLMWGGSGWQNASNVNMSSLKQVAGEATDKTAQNISAAGYKVYKLGDKLYSNYQGQIKESIELTESEMIDLIEQIVLEQKSDKSFGGKKPKGMAETEKAQKGSKKENDAYIKSVTQKLKDYLKDGSKGGYETSPKHFPKGNGEFAKMDKMAYQADDTTQEYIENFTAAGQENLVFDEIHPDEDWMSSNIEGSSKTGNNPEWANSVQTGVNKKRNQIRKDNLLGAVKQMAYNKAPQPVVDDAKQGSLGKFGKNFGKDAGKKATKILNQLESKEEKNDVLLSEEFNKMKNLINYNKKTQ